MSSSFFYPKRKRVAISFEDESLTKQSFKDECDLENVILKHARCGVDLENGMPAVLNDPRAVFGDFSTRYTLQDVLNKSLEVEQYFSSLPSSVRQNFNNSSFEFLSFVSNPANESKLSDLGIFSNSEPLPGSSKVDSENPQT